MTRINTNLASLTTQLNMGKVNRTLSQTTERLATGLRINRGQDDPAGLIASESHRWRMQGLNAALDNSQRASQFISVVDGALGEVSALLIEIKQLVAEASSPGGLSQSEINANQQQIDNAISAIDRIANTTSFAGETVLNGGAAYTLSGVAEALVPISDVRVNHALVPENSPLPVTIEILTQGMQAQQTWDMRRAFLDAAVTGQSTIQITGDLGSHTLVFDTGDFIKKDVVDAINASTPLHGVEASLGSGTLINLNSTNYGPEADFTITAEQPAGAYWSDSVDFLNTVQGEWNLKVVSNSGTRTITFTGPQTANDVVTAVNAVSGATGARASYRNSDISFTSIQAGDSSYVQVSVSPPIYFSDNDSTDTTTVYGGAGTAATYDWNSYSDWLSAAVGGTSSLQVGGENGTQTISLSTGAYTAQDIVDQVNLVSGSTGVTASVVGPSIRFESTATGADKFVRLKGMERPSVEWADPSQFLSTAALDTNTIRVTGSRGTRTLSLNGGGLTANDILTAVNGVTAGTGVRATLNAGAITFDSDGLGPNENVNVLAMHPIPALTSSIDQSENIGISNNDSAAGGDSAIAIRSINFDPRTVVSGLTASLDTLNLNLDISFADFIGQSVGGMGAEGEYTVTTEIYVTGGGSNFQVTADMTPHGRISSGIPSILSSNLGTPAAGFLSQIGSGGPLSIVSGQAVSAASAVDAAIDQVVTLRGDLGQIDRYSIQPMIASQQVALENTMAAESAIRDADFAAEMAEITRAQIVSQAITAAMRIANAQPQAMLQLLR